MSEPKLDYSKLDFKILQLLVWFEGGLNMHQIIKKVSTNYTCANKSLQHLKNSGFIVEQDFGRIRTFRLNRTNKKVKHVVGLFGGDKSE